MSQIRRYFDVLVVDGFGQVCMFFHGLFMVDMDHSFDWIGGVCLYHGKDPVIIPLYFYSVY